MECMEDMEDAHKKVIMTDPQRDNSELELNDFITNFIKFMHHYSIRHFTIHNICQTGLKHYVDNRWVQVEKMVVDLNTQTAMILYYVGSLNSTSRITKCVKIHVKTSSSDLPESKNEKEKRASRKRMIDLYETVEQLV
jgi:hypothetical protein